MENSGENSQKTHSMFGHNMLLLTESAVHTRKYLLWRHAVRTERSEVRAAWRHNKYFPYGPNSRLIRALLYTHTSKTTKSQCFPFLLWTEVQPVHTPVRTQAYGPALNQSNFSILSVICLVYNNAPSLLSNRVNRALVNSNFQLDVGSFTLNFSCNWNFKVKFQFPQGSSVRFLSLVRPIFQNKAQLTFFVSHSSLRMLRFPKLKFEDSQETS